MQADPNVVCLDGANERLRDAFLGWQCRIRQIAMRRHDGRPTSGVTPLVSVSRELTPGSAPSLVPHSLPDAALETGPELRTRHDPHRPHRHRALQAARAFGDDGASPPGADARTIRPNDARPP